jgi:Rieske 2Fe-2S family protein
MNRVAYWSILIGSALVALYFFGWAIQTAWLGSFPGRSLEAYSLMPLRLESWQGFLFLSFDPSAPDLRAWLDDAVEHFERYDLTGLVPAKRLVYDVAANWKFIAENYSECYHCPGIHPQLNKLTPYDLGGDFAPDGPWQGGWMELVDSAETMALDGGHRGSRPAIPGITAVDERRIYYYLLWPSTFLSIHPDYLLVHRLEPAGADHTRIVCQWLFEPETIALPARPGALLVQGRARRW